MRRQTSLISRRTFLSVAAALPIVAQLPSIPAATGEEWVTATLSWWRAEQLANGQWEVMRMYLLDDGIRACMLTATIDAATIGGQKKFMGNGDGRSYLINIASPEIEFLE